MSNSYKVWAKWTAPALNSLTVGGNGSSCFAIADWVVEILGTSEENAGDMAVILNFLQSLIPRDWPHSNKTVIYHEQLMTWYFGVWLNDTYYDRNRDALDGLYEKIFATGTTCFNYETGTYRICERLQVQGDPDVLGRGMVATYIIGMDHKRLHNLLFFIDILSTTSAASLATLYLPILTLGQLRLLKGERSILQNLGFGRLVTVFEDSLDGFLDAALVFASAILGATITRFHHIWYPSGPVEADDFLVLPAIASVVAAILSVFICLTLQTVATIITTTTIKTAATARTATTTQTTAKHPQWGALRLFLWTFVIVLSFILESKSISGLTDGGFDTNGIPSSINLPGDVTNRVDLWRNHCDDFNLVMLLKKLIKIGFGLQAVNLIWYLKTLFTMAFTVYSHQRPVPKWARYIFERLTPSENAWETISLGLRTLMGTICVVAMWVLIDYFMKYRRSFRAAASDSDKDSEWSFGQVLALAQWAPTILTFIDILLRRLKQPYQTVHETRDEEMELFTART
ncbi:hypothetical protein JX265_010119 [Neoarthrinium moseri]|uniref:Uncharacterized protein n=1 Tax=Neoarthrinium moseri TaxID=1658444 RepID=A0A9P9WEY6_9PEZI|nr:hypothetical protein JX265_010119 [Neoarthrinium moseri]